ncbi:hypothetical protein LWF15_16430 [Kineosporia rhizophila]|uniref:hypothetical protein n=1 Tax=Kineosporia TaxID=49184 RepID=UPI001E332A84|nr:MULTISPECIES: hypothetical protein [Kineosporia]MCE0537090.1 hypothetical protein [Kineosporia rhizophila]GLY16065.1 hypothetical protein Kisp01_30800 [Kineosporia sp. NBRC 101677]
MRSVVSKRSGAVRTLVVLPLAALLLAACSGEGSTADQINQLNDTANELNDTAQELESAADSIPDLSQAEDALQDAAQNLGQKGQAELACSTVRAVVSTSEGGDAEAAATQLAATVATIFNTLGQDEEGADSFDLDAVMQEECPKVHTEALEITQRDSLNELYRN